MSPPDKPISAKQLAANRANAQHSTGPRTPEGKRRSAQNARKHGFTASTFAVIRLEELDEVARLRDDLIHDYRPVNAQELFAIERIALAQQSLLRVARLEAGLFTDALDETVCGDGTPIVLISEELTGDIEVTRQQNRNYAVAEGMYRMCRKSNCWALFLRYQVQTERLYRRAIEEFERLKKLRPELPNEAISEAEAQAELEENEEPAPPDETNPITPATPPFVPPSAPFQDHGDPLPHPDAHGAERVPAAGLLQLVHGRRYQPGTARPQRMPDRDRSAVRVDVLRVVRQPQVARHRQCLRGKRLVQLDHIHGTHRQPGLCQHLAGGRSRRESHDPGSDSRRRSPHHARFRRQPILFRRLGRGQQERA